MLTEVSIRVQGLPIILGGNIVKVCLTLCCHAADISSDDDIDYNN